MVSLFVLGHLLKQCRAGTVLHDPTQIGIEVAVPQLPRDQAHPKLGKTVCKDVVIWPQPKWTMWPSNREPLAVMEWKVRYGFGRRPLTTLLEEQKSDIEWLRKKSECVQTLAGYAIFVEKTPGKTSTSCTRLFGGQIHESWLQL